MTGVAGYELAGAWLVASIGAYGATTLVSGAGEVLRKPVTRRVAYWLLAAACAFNGVMIGTMWVNLGRPPFKTVFETMLLGSFCIAAVGLVMVRLHRLSLLTAFAAAGALTCLFYAYSNPDWELIVLPPALQSAWFVPHVITYFVSYGALFISFVLAALALIKRVPQPAKAEGENSISFEQAAHEAAVFGFVALTVGLAMGAAWGKSAWGDYWQWDPKENWALITWLAYLGYHHMRMIGVWRGRRSMWVNVACFGIVLFTYLGMHLLPTAGASQHIYQ